MDSVIYLQNGIRLILLLVISAVTMYLLLKKFNVDKKWGFSFLTSLVAIVGYLVLSFNTYTKYLGLALGTYLMLKFVAKMEEKPLNKLLIIWFLCTWIAEIILGLIAVAVLAFFGLLQA